MWGGWAKVFLLSKPGRRGDGRGRRRACIPVIVVSVRARPSSRGRRLGLAGAPPPRCRARTPARGIANTSPVAPRPRHRSESSEEIARPRRIAGEYDYNYETTSRASLDAPGVAGVAATADAGRSATPAS